MTIAYSGVQVVPQQGNVNILHEILSIRIILSSLYLQYIRFYTSDVQNSEKQSDCVIRHTIVIGHVGCLTPHKAKNRCTMGD